MASATSPIVSPAFVPTMDAFAAPAHRLAGCTLIMARLGLLVAVIMEQRRHFKKYYDAA
jgi:hypothetical protein